jgi:hypothetical protein
MMMRFIFNVAQGKMELTERPPKSVTPARALAIPVNRFIPANFVFRCKAVEGTGDRLSSFYGSA